MKLLQIPTATLERANKKKNFEANPALEEGDDDYNDVFDLDSDYDSEKKNRKQNTAGYRFGRLPQPIASKMAIAIKPRR